MKEITLAQLAPGQKAKIVKIAGGKGLHSRLMSMGVYSGREIVKFSHIGLRGPVVVKIGRSIIALGHGIAEKVIVAI